MSDSNIIWNIVSSIIGIIGCVTGCMSLYLHIRKEKFEVGETLVNYNCPRERGFFITLYDNTISKKKLYETVLIAPLMITNKSIHPISINRICLSGADWKSTGYHRPYLKEYLQIFHSDTKIYDEVYSLLDEISEFPIRMESYETKRVIVNIITYDINCRLTDCIDEKFTVYTSRTNIDTEIRFIRANLS